MSGLYWLASYPKSGNTWARCFLAALTGGGGFSDLDSLADTAPASAACSWLEGVLELPVMEMTPEELALARKEAHRLHAVSAAPPFVLKVHDRYDQDLFPPEQTAGIVYIVRDPRDVAPSFAEHWGKSIDDAVALMNRRGHAAAVEAGYRFQAPQRISSWSDHAASWLDQKASPLLLLRYEDMRSRPTEQFRRLTAFLGLSPDAAALHRAIEASSFAELRSLEDKSGFGERPPHMPRFFRRGLAGAWTRDLAEHQEQRIVADHEIMMTRLGYL